MSGQYGKAAASISPSAERAAALYEKIREQYNRRARSHLRRQIENIVANTEHQLTALRDVGGSTSVALNDYIDKITESVVKLKQLGNELGQPFLLFVVGVGKAGKSTLINALLEQKAAEVGKVPKTWKVDVYQGADRQDKAEIRYRDGTICLKTVQAIEQELAEEEEKRKQSERLVSSELSRIKEIAGDDTDLLEEKKRELQKHHLYRSPVVEVRWPLPTKGVLEKFRLVDTPGLVQEGFFENIEENAVEYYSKADGVIWLLTADVLADIGPREEMGKILARFGNRTGNIIAIVNQIDKVRKNGGADAVASVMENARGKYGDLFSEIIPFSAHEAFCGAMEADQAKIDASGINVLRGAIERRFVTRAQSVQVQSKTSGVAGIVADIMEVTGAYIAKLEAAEAKRRNCVKNWETDIEAFSKQSRTNIETCFSAQIEKIRRNAIANENSLWDLPDEQRNAFINEKICEGHSFEAAVERMRKDRYVRLDSLTQAHKMASAFAEFPLLAAKGFLTRAGTGKEKMASFRVEDSSFGENEVGLMVGGGAALASCAALGPIGLLAFFVIETDFGKELVKFFAKMFTNLPEKIVAQYQGQLDRAKFVLVQEENEWVAAARNEVEAIREKTFCNVIAPSEHIVDILARMRQIYDAARTEIAPLSIVDIIMRGDKDQEEDVI